ncbi:MAG TPA: hypothetical protein VK797_05560 [Tepidisphaeraceae bacterium]|jgi:hypothetical protein|nr:hypothetical protein [Tepidisphaeraceae bacterium]
MRSTILVIFSAITLAALFIGYWTMQPAPATSTSVDSEPVKVGPAPKRNDPNQNNGIRSGEFAWLKQHDRDGVVSSEFTGDAYHPRPNGTVDVSNPAGIFYLANHQRLEVHGKTGNIVLKEVPDPAKSAFGAGPSAPPPSPPTRGRLDDVTVTLFDETRPKDQQVVLVMTTNNIVFDNESFHIFTQGYRDQTGKLIDNDQVPVVVHGQIEMRGRGLKARWNDRDGRLEELEIAHGDVLVITDPANFSLGGPQKKAKSPVAAMGLLPPLPAALAAADNQSAGDVITSYTTPTTQPHAPTHEAHPPVVYGATFYDHVRINQPDPSGKFDQLLIENVDQMVVDFLLKQSSNSAATQPASSATQAAAAPTTTTEPQGPAPSQIQVPAPAPVLAPAASQPAEKEQPIYVHWTGLLRITPLQQQPSIVPLKPGESAVRLIGLPVNVHRVDPKQQGIEHVQCASLVYNSSTQHVRLDRSTRFPQVLIDKSPAPAAKDQGVTHFASAGVVEYSRAEQRATVTGPGRGLMPLEASAQSPASLMHVAWQKEAQFNFAPGATDDQLLLRSGRFVGDVDIQHPRLTLRSQTLDLAFEPTPKRSNASSQPSSAQSNLRQAVAKTNVYCVLTGSDGKKQTIESDRLQLDSALADRKVYPRHVNATGSVHAYADDDLRAENLDVLLKPAPPPRIAKSTTRKSADDDAAQVQLDELVAWDHVTAKSKDGSVAIGDKLTVTQDNGKQRATIASSAQAKVADPKGNFVTGPEIQFDSGDGKSYVVGPGALHAIRQASTTQPAEPVDVAWATGAMFDGQANRVDCDGSVNAQFRENNGYLNTATADHIRIDLEKKPPPATTQPIMAADVQPRKAGGKKTEVPEGAQMDMFKGKEVVAFVLTSSPGDADLTSTLNAADHSIAQQIALEGPKIIVRLVDPNYPVDPNDPEGLHKESISVPTAGKMLVRDHRRSAAQPSQSESRGATVCQWQRSLVYSRATQRADMVGKVKIVHMDEDKAQLPVQVIGEHVIAWFEQSPQQSRPRSAAPRKSPSQADDDSRLQLKYVRILAGDTDVVSVDHGESEMRAREVDYDPARHLLIAHGTQSNPIAFFSGTTLTTADAVEWDTITWNPAFRNAILDSRPATPGVQAPKPQVPDKDKLPYRRGQ